MSDRGFPEVTSVRGSRSRPESYDTAASFVKVPGNHGDVSPYIYQALDLHHVPLPNRRILALR